MEVVNVTKLKRPVGSGRWIAYVLRVDNHGTWVHAPAGSLYRGEDGRSRSVCEVAQNRDGVGQPIVQLIAPGAWWIATWYPAQAAYDVTVDVCTPAVLSERTWTYVDLELDPWRNRAGAVATDDWEEFRAACTANQISPREALQATAAAAAVEGLLERRVEPFGDVGATTLTAALALRLPPLVGVVP